MCRGQLTWTSRNGSACSARNCSAWLPWSLQQEGYREVTLQSVRLARWWQAAGFAKTLPEADHVGKGWVPRVPSAILEAERPCRVRGIPARAVRGRRDRRWRACRASRRRTSPSPRKRAPCCSPLAWPQPPGGPPAGGAGDILQVRLRNVDHALNFDEMVGFIGERKSKLMVVLEPDRSAKKDYVYLPGDAWTSLVPAASCRT